MSFGIRKLAVALMLFVPASALAGGDKLEIKGKVAENDPADPVRQKPAKIHEVKLAKGQAYQLDLVSKDFDTYLRLVNAAGQEVASDDDGGGGLNSRLKYTPTEDGTFKIYVTSFAGGEGDYVLTVQGPNVGAAGAGGIKGKEGDVVLNINDKISEDDKPDPVRRNPGKVHEVKVKKGTAYQIDMMSKQFDTYLRLEDDGGKELAQDDDGGEGLNSRIKFTAEKDGTFKIFATTFQGGEGKYVLIVKSAGGPGAAPAGAVALNGPTADKPATHDGQLKATDPADAVRKHPSKLHVIELKQGKSYVIDVMSQDFDTFLRVENGDGKELAFNDDGGEGLNSRLEFTPPADGRYRLIVTSFAGGQGGYNLVVTQK